MTSARATGDSSLRVSASRDGDTGVIAVAGAYDPACLELLEAELRELDRLPVQNLVLDVSRLELVDAEGLGEVLRAWSRVHRDGVRLILVRVPRHMRPIVEATGLAGVLPIVYERSRFDRG